MFIRPPVQGPLANSNARLALMLRSERGTRVVELGDRTVTVLLLLSALLLAWYLFATLYLVFRDDFIASTLNSQRRTYYAYEDRILELRAKIDRITARQLLNQDSIEDRVASVVARQAELEARQFVVADLGTRAGQTGLAMTGIAITDAVASLPGKSIPPASADPLAAAFGRKPRPLPTESGTLEPVSTGKGFAPAGVHGPLNGIVDEIERRSKHYERAQIEVLKSIDKAADDEIARSRKMVAVIGLDPSRFGKAAFGIAPIRGPAPLDELRLRDVNPDTMTNSAMGGPLLPPLPSRHLSEAFEVASLRAEGAIEGTKNARSVLRALPIGRPLDERYGLSSNFGGRLDPFTRSLAHHSGLDFRAPTGTPVRAAAAGRIIDAGPNGGYGRMVEIDHGYGITTRYAHMSSIAVNDGDRIEKGAVLGYVGTTGRSTGSHLHYEVRVDDDATDPKRFLQAAKILAQN